MSEQLLQRIQFVTTYYPWLQGLRFVPFGVVQLVFAVWLALPEPEGVDAKGRLAVGLLLLLGGQLVATGLYAWVGRYYRQRFGEVQLSATTRQRMQRAISVSLVVGLIVGLVTALIRGSAQLPSGEVPLTGFLVLSALAMVWYWHWSGRMARHYLGVAASFVVLAVLHAVDANPVYALLRTLPFTSDARGAAVTLVGIWGLAVLVMGVMDHRLLVRTLGNEPEPEAGTEEVPG